jgi:hypothetical protein
MFYSFKRVSGQRTYDHAIREFVARYRISGLLRTAVLVCSRSDRARVRFGCFRLWGTECRIGNGLLCRRRKLIQRSKS